MVRNLEGTLLDKRNLLISSLQRQVDSQRGVNKGTEMYGSVGKGKGREVYILMIDYNSVGNLSNNSVVYESEV